MTREEINNGNYLIAEYMGFKNIRNNGYYVICYIKAPNGWEAQYPTGVIKTFLYNESWNELMPVCKKIVESYSDNRTNIFAGLSSVDLEATFKAVIEFIEFWNDETKPKYAWKNLPSNYLKKGDQPIINIIKTYEEDSN